MTRVSRLQAFAVIGLTVTLAASAASQARNKRQDPDDDPEVVFMQRRAFENACLTCHGAAIVAGQRFNSAQWSTSIDKMIGLGARVDAEDRDALLGYLTHHVKQPETMISAASVEKPAWDGVVEAPSGRESAERGGVLYAQHCASCHGAAARGGDPGNNLVEAPILLDRAAFAAIIRDGKHRMPAFAGVVGDEATNDILSWLRSLAYDPISVP